MRDHVLAKLTEIAKKDDRVFLFTGDLGYVVLDGFKNSFPHRFVNVGIAEQNMTAMAAGMAKAGNIVFTYSIGNFSTLRCIEQIRNDVCYHHANVKILAVGGGLAYGNQGITHHATEDIAMMRSLPNMRVYVPGDAYEAEQCLNEAYETDGPAYIRLARNKEQNYHLENESINIANLLPVATDHIGTDANLLTTGSILSEGVPLVNSLRQTGFDVGLFSVPRIKPIDENGIKTIAEKCNLIISLEDHQISGGLGGAVAEVISEISGQHASLYRAGLKNQFSEATGSQEYLRDYYGFSASALMRIIPNMIDEQKAIVKG